MSADVSGSVSSLISAVLAGYIEAKSQRFSGSGPIGASFLGLQEHLATLPAVSGRATLRLVPSYGKGNWATIPWLSLLDDRETSTTQRGLYVVFLWRADMSGVYLAVSQGVTEPRKRGALQAKQHFEVERLHVLTEAGAELGEAGFSTTGIDLASDASLARGYAEGTIAHKFYARSAIPGDFEINADLEVALSAVERSFETRPATEATTEDHRVVAIYVGAAAESNLAVGLAGGVWGWKKPQPALASLPIGTPVVFGIGFSGGSPRASQEDWRQHAVRRLVLARTTGTAFESAVPFWPDEVGEVSYPHRLPIEPIREFGAIPLGGDGQVSVGLSNALKRSVSGGNAVVVDDKAEWLRPPNVVATKSLHAIGLSFEEALRASGMALGPEAEVRSRAFLAAAATKPFVILSGLSGSGKTQLAMRLGEWFGVSADGRNRFLPVAVRPDWSGPEALLGYEDALRASRDGDAAWFVPETLEFVIRAAREPAFPFLVLLDEMNLAHVERYFSDFLSGMESRLPIIPNLARGADGEWRLAAGEPAKLPVPPNLIVVGTVNVDETTYLFSPKVLDRASTFEVRTATSELVAAQARPTAATIGRDADLRGLVTFLSDDGWHRSQPSADEAWLADRLTELHRVLSETGDEFGHRLFYESLRFAASLELIGGRDRSRVLDHIVLLKLLPKIHGSRRRVEGLLSRLRGFAEDPNSFSVGSVTKESSEAPQLPRTAAKLDRMLRAVQINQFVSFTE